MYILRCTLYDIPDLFTESNNFTFLSFYQCVNPAVHNYHLTSIAITWYSTTRFTRVLTTGNDLGTWNLPCGFLSFRLISFVIILKKWYLLESLCNFKLEGYFFSEVISSFGWFNSSQISIVIRPCWHWIKYVESDQQIEKHLQMLNLVKLNPV